MKQDKFNDEALQSLFDTELELPQSLQTDAVKDRLQTGNIKQFKPKKHLLPKLIAAAAAVAIVVTSVSLLPRHRHVTVIPVTEPSSQSAGERFAPMSLPAVDDAPRHIVEHHAHQHQEHIHWLAPGIEDEREHHEHCVLHMVALHGLPSRNPSVEQSAQHIAQCKCRNEDKQEEQI